MNKTIWIVNEYNGPTSVRSRQSILCQRLIEAGYDAYVISGSVEHKTRENTIIGEEQFKYIECDKAKHFVIKTKSYHRNFERVLVSLQFQKQIWKLRNKLPKPDVIISDFAGLFGNVFLKWKRKYGTKIIYDILDLWPEAFIDMGYLKKNSLIAKILYSMEHKSYREADGIIFSFEGGRNYIIDKGWSKEVGGDVDTSNIGYLNNGVDLETVDRNKQMNFYSDSDLDNNKFKIIYLGSISEFNGLDVLVETAKILQDKGIDNVLILIYGYGTQEEKLKKLVDFYKLRNVKFKGKIDIKYAPSLLSHSDLNLFTFKNTNLLKYGVSPNKLFMYFASGKPVLSMIKPAYDLVEEKKAGISVRNDPKLVADMIQYFLKMDTKVYNEYCNNSRKIAEEFDYKNLVKILIDKIEN